MDDSVPEFYLEIEQEKGGSKNLIVDFSKLPILPCFNIDDTKMRSAQMRFLTLKDNLLILYAKMEC